MKLTLANNSSANPQTVDLSPYVDVQDGDGLDFANPQYSAKVWGHSLLRAGATEALETNFEREILIPLKLGPIGGVAGAPTTLSQTLALIQQINAIGRTHGMTLTWQADGAASATVFDGISVQVDVEYQFRREQQRWTQCKLRFFAQPFGRTAAPRPYAAASGVGPLLLISPYASGGALATVPSAVGFGASGGIYGPNGASGGISYSGNPSLAGDAPALLQISYVGPLPVGATESGPVPYAAVSLLPDALYQPLITAPQISLNGGGLGGARVNDARSTASQYITLFNSSTPLGAILGFAPAASAPLPVAWAGQHRLLAIARASGGGNGYLYTVPNPLVGNTATATLQANLDWGIYDLGTFTIRPSQSPTQQINVELVSTTLGGSSTSAELMAFAMLPDNATWFLSPTQIIASQYGWPPANRSIGSAPYTNTLFLDDTLSEQFVYCGPSQTFAPSPAGMGASSARITPYTRGLLPAPDPKNGLPIIAILSAPQNHTASTVIQQGPGNPNTYTGLAAASWTTAQNLRTMAQINVLERFRYVAS